MGLLVCEYESVYVCPTRIFFLFGPNNVLQFAGLILKNGQACRSIPALHELLDDKKTERGYSYL